MHNAGGFQEPAGVSEINLLAVRFVYHTVAFTEPLLPLYASVPRI
jgi:hypothetical protein